jgi:hypothetical protein
VSRCSKLRELNLPNRAIWDHGTLRVIAGIRVMPHFLIAGLASTVCKHWGYQIRATVIHDLECDDTGSQCQRNLFMDILTVLLFLSVTDVFDNLRELQVIVIAEGC